MTVCKLRAYPPGRFMLAALTTTQNWLLAAGAATTLLWLALLSAASVTTRPREVRAGPRTSELRDEPAAVVALITNGWQLPRTAAPATLLDLAARRYLDIEQYGSDRVVCRLRPNRRGKGPLTAYEEQVLAHLESKAVDRIVPGETLTTGRDDMSWSWWHAFRAAVIDDARRRGLSRPRWSPGAYWVILGTALVPAVTWALFTASKSGSVFLLLSMVVLFWLGFANCFAVPVQLRGERATEEGREAAANWLGVRDYIGDTESFEDLPPAAVAIWDRYLAAAVALGIATRATHALPLATHADRQAVVRSGGRWRTVRITYPLFIWPPGWGLHPAAALGVGLLGTLLAGAAVWAIVREPDFLMDPDIREWQFLLMSVPIACVAVAASVWGCAVLVRAIAGLVGRRTVEGEVLRARALLARSDADKSRRRYVVIDDGHSTRIRGSRLPRELYEKCGEGDLVRALAYPQLGWISKLDVARRATPGLLDGLAGETAR